MSLAQLAPDRPPRTPVPPRRWPQLHSPEPFSLATPEVPAPALPISEATVHDPDALLMYRVRDDDESAFRELVEKYQHRLLAVLERIIGDAVEAEDLAQEVFLRVYRARKRYRAQAKFSTWLFTIANRVAFNARRRRQRKPSILLRVQELEQPGARPVDQVVTDRKAPSVPNSHQQEVAEIVRRAVDNLSESQRVAVMLNKFEDMSYSEIAKVMQLSTTAVKSLLHRARVNLRTSLQDHLGVDGRPLFHVIQAT